MTHSLNLYSKVRHNMNKNTIYFKYIYIYLQ